ncbi:hypothetical protein P9112_009527 [Eukaryota sp. TZLM1-RC]
MSRSAKTFGKSEGSIPDLPGDVVDGKVVTRFPPEPSGFLHIGHVKAALLNNYYARHYGGKLLLRFDDTNPSKEKGDYVTSITEDLHRLGIVPDSISHTSDYFPLFIEKCEELLRLGDAFVDDTPVDLMRQQRGNRQPSERRENTVERNFELWEEMKKGTPKGLECCVRAKIDPTSQNGTLRDPVIYRCNVEPHIRTGTQYKVYPTYDFVCPIIDSIEGVTHALRTNEYRERNVQYDWFLNKFNLRKVHIHDFGRLNFEYSVMSKRLLSKFVDKGIVDGWNDPRFPTVQGVFRRGLTLKALSDFILLQGSSDALIQMEWDKIWAMNKQVLEPVAPRYNAVIDPIVVELVGEGACDSVDWREMPLVPKDAALGTKMVPYFNRVLVSKEDVQDVAIGDKVTLMGWGNAFVENVVSENGVVEGITMRLALDDKVFKKTWKIQWVADVPDVIRFDAAYFGYLVNVKKVEAHHEFDQIANPNSKKTLSYVGEPAMKTLSHSQHLQLQRLGFFIVDQAPVIESGLKLIYVPSGKGTLTLEDIFKKKKKK